METILEIADIIRRIGGAVVIIMIVIVLFHILRLVLAAKGIVWWVKKSVETAQQSVFSWFNVLGSLFSSTDDEFDDEV